MAISGILPLLTFSLFQRIPDIVPDEIDGSPHFAARVLARMESSEPIRLNYLVVPVRFATRDSTFSVEAISRTFDGDGPTVSVERFYREQSRGKVELSFRHEPWMLTSVARDSLAEGVADKADYYSKVMDEIASRSASKGIQLSDFDNDGDGLVDGLVVVLAGREYQETQDLGDPGTGVLSFAAPVELASGAKIQRLLHVSEIALGKPTDPGSVSHELAHMLGAADLYDQDRQLQGRTGGVGSWDVMSEGNVGKWWVSASSDSLARRKPSGFCAFSRMQLGWLQPKEIEFAQEVRLKPGEAARLWTDSLRTSEYLLLENRDRSGVDSILPGPGLLVMRVRTDKLLRYHSGTYRAINADSSRMGVQVLEASGRQDMSKTGWTIPSPEHLFGGAVDSLTDDGPVPLMLPDGTRTGAWVRGIRMDGQDVVFRASPAKRLGYGWETGNGSLASVSLGTEGFSIVMPVPVPADGRIVAMTSTIPQRAGKVCVGIWDKVSPDALGAPIVSACDSGGFAGESFALRRFRHDLEVPIPVRSGQELWIGQTIAAIGGNTRFCGMEVDPEIDTTWIFYPGSRNSLVAKRPLVGIMVQTDSSTAWIEPRAAARHVGIRRLGDRLRLDGAGSGESIRLALRDPRGRILWRGEVNCDASGSVSVAIPVIGSGMLIAEAEGSFGTRTSLLPRP